MILTLTLLWELAEQRRDCKNTSYIDAGYQSLNSLVLSCLACRVYIYLNCTYILNLWFLGKRMFDSMWEAIFWLENLGFRVLAVCCDGLAANHRLFSLHRPGSTTTALVYKVPNPHAHDGERRSLYSLSDPPHLIKTVQNCLTNYKQQLWVHFAFIPYIVWCSTYSVQWNGHFLEVPHWAVWEEQITSSRYLALLFFQSSSMSLHLTSYSTMCVDLAAQVYKLPLTYIQSFQCLWPIAYMYNMFWAILWQKLSHW